MRAHGSCEADWSMLMPLQDNTPVGNYMAKHPLHTFYPRQGDTVIAGARQLVCPNLKRQNPDHSNGIRKTLLLTPKTLLFGRNHYIRIQAGRQEVYWCMLWLLCAVEMLHDIVNSPRVTYLYFTENMSCFVSMCREHYALKNEPSFPVVQRIYLSIMEEYSIP